MASEALAIDTAVTSSATSKSSALGDDDGDVDELFGLNDASTAVEQLYVLMRQSAPIMTSLCLEMSGNMINLFFAARCSHPTITDEAIFAGISLAVTFASFSFYAVIVGMSSAIDTLGSQLNGAGKHKDVGVLLLRACLIMTVLSVPIVVVWWNAFSVFSSLGVEPTVCTVIQRYLRIHILSIPIEIFNVAYEKHITAVGRPDPTVWANIAFVLTVFVLDLIFVSHLHLDYTYLAVAFVLASYVWGSTQFILSLQYKEVTRTLRYLPFAVQNTTDVWRKWGEFLYYGFPGIVTTCSEWWAMEILTLMAVQLGTSAVAAGTIVQQFLSTLIMFPLGISISATALVGNAYGAQQHNLVRHLGRVAVLYTATVEIIIVLGVFFCGKWFFGLYTRSAEVRVIAENTLTVLILTTFSDGLQTSGSAVLKGVGKQHISAVINVIAYYVIGLPLSWVCCFRLGYGVTGLIMGMLFANTAQIILLWILFYFFSRYIYTRTTDITDTAQNQEKLELLPLEQTP